MSADSLHTKYRPEDFEAMVGQTHIVKSLKKIVKDNRAHAFVFHGPAGTGKTTLARILATHFCGGKPTAHNLQEIPAAIYTGTDAVRQIVERTLTRAIGNSPVKVLVFDEAHRLSANAWDALLKAIEEPPSHVYYVFCTTNISKIPKTIQTRCVSFETKPLSEDHLIDVLVNVVEKEGIEVDEEIIEAIAENAEGSARQALVYLEACKYCESKKEALATMQKAGQSKEAIDLCRFLIQRRNRTWRDAQRLLKELKESEAESIRIVVCNYFASAILGSKSDKDAIFLLGILESFSEPYNSSEKFAPLILSVAEAIGMGG
jgi:DNA polymerase III gamma/tau subunit